MLQAVFVELCAAITRADGPTQVVGQIWQLLRICCSRVMLYKNDFTGCFGTRRWGDVHECEGAAASGSSLRHAVKQQQPAAAVAA